MKIQLTLPERNQETLKYCNSHEKTHLQATDGWIKSLPTTDLKKTGKQLIIALNEIIRLNCDPALQFQLAEKLHSIAITATRNIHQRYLNQSITFDPAQQAYFDLCSTLLQTLSTTYISVVQNSIDHKKTDKTLAQACHRAMADSSQIYLLDCQFYRSPPKGFWLNFHTLYQIADHFKILDYEQVDIHCDKTKALSIATIYKRSLLISRSRYNKLTSEEINQTWSALAIWAPHCKISKNSGLKIYFAVNINADEGMHYAAPDPDKPAKGVIGIDARVLSTHLTKLRDKADAKSALSSQLLSHLASAWSQISKRQHPRQQSTLSCMICSGFSAVHYQLSGKQKFNDLIAPYADNHASGKSAFNSDKKDDVWSEVHDVDDDNEGKLLSTKSESIIEFNKQPSTDNQLYAPESSQVINTSAGGYCLKLVNPASGKLNVGDPLVIKEYADDEKKSWLLAAIRWIEVLDNKDIKMGIELISAKVEPCAIALIHKTRETSRFQRCFLLPEISAIGQHSSLMMPGLGVKPGHKFRLLHNETVKKGQLLKCASSTSSYSEYQYRLFN